MKHLDQLFKFLAQLRRKTISIPSKRFVRGDKPVKGIAKRPVQYPHVSGDGPNNSFVLTCRSLAGVLHEIVVDVGDPTRQVVSNTNGDTHNEVCGICGCGPILRTPDRLPHDINNFIKGNTDVVERSILERGPMLLQSLEVLKRTVQTVSGRDRCRNCRSKLGYLELHSQHLLLSAFVQSKPTIAGSEHKRCQTDDPRTNRRHPVRCGAGFIEYFEAAWCKPPFSDDQRGHEQYRKPYDARYGQSIKDCSSRLIAQRKLCRTHSFPWSRHKDGGILA
ncbi:hypothetical protein STLA111740_00565 [Stenotrophomonas lactitubi]